MQYLPVFCDLLYVQNAGPVFCDLLCVQNAGPYPEKTVVEIKSSPMCEVSCYFGVENEPSPSGRVAVLSSRKRYPVSTNLDYKCRWYFTPGGFSTDP